jgi:dipeptidyl aminopeptidase/acylaminoacyl peptidase
LLLPALAACGGGGSHVVKPAERHLVYVSGDDPAHGTVWVADVDGSHARALGPGSLAALSPDGRSVAVLRRNGIYVLSVHGGHARRLTSEKLHPEAWSPDGTTLIATRPQTLSVLELDGVDTTTGKVRVIASGSVYGFSFSPDGDKLAYASAPVATGRSLCGDQSDIYVTKVSGGKKTRLTHEGVDAFPVWGPAGIAYLRLPDDVDYQSACSAPGIWMMKDDGSDAKPVIDRAPLLLSQDGLYGLQPLAWLDDSHILAGIRTNSGTLGAIVDLKTRKLRTIRDFADTASSDGRYSVGDGGDGQTVHLSIVRLSDLHRSFRRANACCPSWNR